MNEKPKRRWLQFSVRGLLLLTLVIAVLLGWTVKGRRERNAVEALEKMGYWFEYCDAGPPTVVGWLWALLDDERKNVITVGSSQFTQATDAGLVHVQDLNQLQTLILGRTQITDAGLVHLEGLVRLQYLNLGGTQITDGGLVNLHGMKQLQRLYLNATKLTDGGLVHLQGLTQLQTLNLDGTQITDAGLVHLQGLTRLKSLSLNGTQATYAGVRGLQKALPNCFISCL